MPQFDISTYIPQIFWLIVTFFAFWFVMDRFIVPKIQETLEQRRRKLDDIILKAEKINKKALSALNKYEETIAAAKINASEKIKQNEEDLKTYLEEKEAELDMKLKEKIKESEAYLDKELNKTLSKTDEIAELTALKILKNLSLNVTIEDIKKVSK